MDVFEDELQKIVIQQCRLLYFVSPNYLLVQMSFPAVNNPY